MRKLPVIFLIYAFTALAWLILGGTILKRTHTQDYKLKGMVSQLWGTVQMQKAPSVYYKTKRKKEIERIESGKTVKEFEKEMDNDLSKLLEGSLYFRTILSLLDRQIAECAMLAATRAKEELRLQVNTALNRGYNPIKMVKAFLQIATYAGVSATNEALEVYKEVLKERREWPIKI